MKTCEWCQEEVPSVVPVVNHDFARSWQHGHCFVCPTCAELSLTEHTALWEMPLFTEPRRKNNLVGRLAA